MTSACATCGEAIDPTAASYSEEGQLICKRCEAKQTIRIGDRRATDAILGAALAAVALGVTSLGCNPAFLMSFAAVGSGTTALFALVRHPEYRATLGDAKWTIAWICAPIGILLGLTLPALLVLSLLLAAVS